MCDLLELCSEPLVDAFGMEYVLANWYLSHWIAQREFLETDHAFRQLERIQLLIIRPLLYQLNQLVHPLKSLLLCFWYIANLVSSPCTSYAITSILLLFQKLLLHLPLFNANSDNCAYTDTDKRDHENKEDKRNNRKDRGSLLYCLFSLQRY